MAWIVTEFDFYLCTFEIHGSGRDRVGKKHGARSGPGAKLNSLYRDLPEEKSWKTSIRIVARWDRTQDLQNAKATLCH